MELTSSEDGGEAVSRQEGQNHGKGNAEEVRNTRPDPPNEPAVSRANLGHPWDTAIMKLRSLADGLPSSIAVATRDDVMATVSMDPKVWVATQEAECVSTGENFDIPRRLAAHGHGFWGWEGSYGRASRVLSLSRHVRRGDLGVNGLCSFYEYLMDQCPAAWEIMEVRLEWLIEAVELM